LNVTTIYVTHDQVEAMTMGDRVAVIRKGKLQQVDTPQRLYDLPVNLFVAGFIGSPAMNMVEATISTANGSVHVEFGGQRLGVPPEVLVSHAGLRAFEGGSVVVGLRPEDIEDASLVPEAPQDRRVSTVVDLRESLGADVVIHFTVDAPAVVTEDTKELAHDVGHDRLEAVEQMGSDHSEFLARLSPRTTATQGQPIDLVVDVTRLHFFDPESGLAVYGDGA
jgi:multiple sugar transport system ATP-binding protein